MNNRELVLGLKKIQDGEGLTDGEMANRLGCARQLYQATKTGKISVGLTILKGAVKAFPELTGSAIIFLTDGADIQTPPADVSAEPYQTTQNRFLGVFWHWLKGFH